MLQNYTTGFITLAYEYRKLQDTTNALATIQEMKKVLPFEWRANSFAAEFLIPESVVKEDPNFQVLIQLERESEILEEISKKYKVSKKAILVRLKTLSLINHKQYETFIQFIEEKPMVEKRTFFLTPEKRCIQEKGEKFVSTVLEGKERGIITTHEAIEYLSVKLKYMNKIEKIFIS